VPNPTERVLALGEQLATAPLRIPLAVLGALAEPVRADLRRSVRRSLGVPADPPPRAADPGRAFLPPGGVARRVHGDLPAMVIGGLAALLLQTLHPLAMAGVAEHSRYQDDPIGRLRRTASFVGTTSFGTVDEANAAIENVRKVHRRVHGRSPDGRRYSANDPELLTWVHVAEMHSFLAAARRYGPRPLSQGDCDRYFAETAVVARSLGARWVPESVDEVTAYFQRVRPELYAGPQALVARDFLLHGVATRLNDRAMYAAILAAALAILPGWAKAELRIPTVPFADLLVVTPVARVLCGALRWTVSPPAHPDPGRARSGRPAQARRQ
jgi:uncharacterized protein (DUF2236 family)